MLGVNSKIDAMRSEQWPMHNGSETTTPTQTERIGEKAVQAWETQHDGMV